LIYVQPTNSLSLPWLDNIPEDLTGKFFTFHRPHVVCDAKPTATQQCRYKSAL